MIIDNSTIALTASHQRSEIKQQQISHRLFIQELQALVIPSSRLPRGGPQLGQANRSEMVVEAGAVDRASNRAEQTGTVPAALRLPLKSYMAQFMGFSAGLRGQFQLAPTDYDPVRNIATAAASPLLGGGADSSIRLFQALFDALAGRSHGVVPVIDRVNAVTSAALAPVFSRSAVKGASDSTLTTDPSGTESAHSTVPVSRLRDGSALSRPMIELNVQVSEYYKETECTAFSACGQVQTRDGETIDFNLNLEMSRSYESVQEYQRTDMMEFKDPLVVNFDGSAAELSEDKYQFDLDADGEMDWISFVAEQGGLLVLDRNEDGVINDGAELFGALSGNGFADLRQYDDDGNGFIDEADAIFADLRIWTKTAAEDRLDSLLDRDVGAIYLGSTETPFELNDEQNRQHGRVRHSSVYLQQDGAVGTVQQIDMVV